MDSLASCPFCPLALPSSELQRHANSHFDAEDDEQLARDMALAHQLAQSEETIGDRICSLISMQNPSPFYSVEHDGGLIALLRTCLQRDSNTGIGSVTLLSGYVDHFQTLPYEDVGWGCGWRNIQMLSSHLLRCRQDARDVLFGGSAFIPDIPSLQRWLELAWEKGFDSLGSHHFNQSICGSQKWIGTTECAALFRSFGLRARIVDFGPKQLQPLFLSVPGTSLDSNASGERKAFQVFGPMDRYLPPRNSHVPQKGDKQTCSAHTETCGVSKKSEGPQVLLGWVHNYFADQQSLTVSSHHHRVIVTDKPPLYFQHDGHSRTIVGIQLVHHKNGRLEHTLLILDPSHRTTTLERSLKENVGWKKLIKRGVHTLAKSQYQLCYIDPGIASKEEMEQLKTLNSVFIKI